VPEIVNALGPAEKTGAKDRQRGRRGEVRAVSDSRVGLVPRILRFSRRSSV
jgi:hypothetical protein